MPIRLPVACMLAILVLPSTLSAQSNNEVNAGIQFDFSQPGARSLALGGAFVAMADDATAAWSNPAGLTLLTQKEVAIEGRVWKFNNLVASRGMAFGPPSGIGFDTVQGVQNAESTDTTASPSFISFVLPARRWAVAFYRHQLTNYKATVVSEGPFIRTTDFRQDPQGEIDRQEPFSGDLELKIADYGAAFAVKVNDAFSIGGTIGLYDFSFSSTNNRTRYVPIAAPPIATRPLFTAAGQRFGPPDFSSANIARILTQSGDDQSVGFNIGVLVKQPKWAVGGAIRQGPDFTINSNYVRGPAEPPSGSLVVPDKEVPFAVPDSYAAGFSVRPVDPWVISFEYDRVMYSQLSDNNVEVLGLVEGNPQLGANITSGLRFPDSNQLRVGTEFAQAVGTRTLLWRIGGWYDPDHRLRYEGDLQRLLVLYQPGEDQFHIAPGFGVAFPKGQLDLAVDLSERVKTVAFSTVFRF